MNQEEGGHLFREAWITGVKRYYPGEPKSGYIVPWNEMQEWEQQAAMATFEVVRQFIILTGTSARKLTREQKSRFVSIGWIGQIYRHFETPKESYIADWDTLPEWQRETDADIFDVIEQAISKEVTHAAS